jgi:hypothetical protein
MLLDDARWNESPDPSDVGNKLQDITTDLAVFQIDRDLESDWLRNRQVCRQLNRKDSICIFPICRYVSIRMGAHRSKQWAGWKDANFLIEMSLKLSQPR